MLSIGHESDQQQEEGVDCWQVPHGLQQRAWRDWCEQGQRLHLQVLPQVH
jgi:hypothetical protein